VSWRGLPLALYPSSRILEKGLYKTSLNHYGKAMRTHPLARSIALAVVSLLATNLSSSALTINIPVPDFSFDANGANYQGSSYANQNPVSYSAYPTNEIYADWETTSANYQTFITSTGGYTGTFQGTTAGQINGPYQTVELESLNPVTTIANNAIYTLTFALSTPGGAGDVAIQLLATTQAADPTIYTSGGSPPVVGTSPYPIITTVDTLASTPVSDLNTHAGVFTDYSTSFSTVGGLNSSYVGDNLSIALFDAPGSTITFDNVRLSEVVAPEPSTYAMMLGGLALLGFCIRRKLA
jgi:hypothetical protein